MTSKVNHQAQPSHPGVDRRRFIGAMGALGASSFLGAGDALAQVFVPRTNVFGRMFPRLHSFFEKESDELNRALIAIGKRGGVLDARDKLPASSSAADQAQAAINLIVDPALRVNNPDNPTHTAGTTFMGQFMDHDMTFDQTSALGKVTDPDASPNTRSPVLDLDSIYLGGPRRAAHLYGFEGSNVKFKVGFGGLFEDLPRNAQGVAIIGDPRNDENLMISQLHAAFLKFHNAAVDWVKAYNSRLADDEIFEEARRLTRWHYQWMIVHEFLPLFIGQTRTSDILKRGRRFYRPRVAFIPVEFSGAAYRFGHSMIRPSYRANRIGNPGTDPGAPAFFGMIFDPAGEGKVDPVDLRGGKRAPRRFIGWETFFDFGPLEVGSKAPAVKHNKLIDARISTPIFLLPTQAIPGFEHGQPISLPARNLLRNVTWSLPSGQSIARKIGADPLDPSELPQFPSDFRLNRSTPLWAYCLQEAFVRAGGLTLGPVGGTIVGEVIIGLLELDQNAYLNASRDWKPTLPQRNGKVTGEFRMVDFLTFAGVHPQAGRSPN
jgi:hypothetical protein